MIAVVIPARNEADVIGTSVASLLRQSCVESLHIFVVDDNSSDGTVEAVRKAAVQSSHGERVSVIDGSALPPAWSGKLWAVQQGVEQALALGPEFLLLSDADIEHSPGNVAALVRIAETGDYDLASFMVKYGEAALQQPGGKASHPSVRILFLPALSAQMDSQRTAQDRRRRGWLYVDSPGGA